MRRVLGVLRDAASDCCIRRLASHSRAGRSQGARRASGRARGERRPAPLPPAVDLSAYRIVQEALTNVLKHAGRHADVVDVRSADALELEARRGRGDGGTAATAGTAWSGCANAPRCSAARSRRGRAGGGFAVARAAGMGGPGRSAYLLADDQAFVRTGSALISEAEPTWKSPGRRPTARRRLPPSAGCAPTSC